MAGIKEKIRRIVGPCPIGWEEAQILYATKNVPFHFTEKQGANVLFELKTIENTASMVNRIKKIALINALFQDIFLSLQVVS